LHTDCRVETIDAPADSLASRDGQRLGSPKGGVLALEPTLLAPTPNPTHAGADVAYRLPVGSTMNLGIYDAAGRLVRRLISQRSASAEHGRVHWDGRDETGSLAASGVYFLRLDGRGFSRAQKLIVIR
jgi:hypothetical protein